MLNIKTFKDGNRFVVVFEGLSNMPSEEDMIKNYISSIVNANISTEKEIDAKPVETTDEPIPVPIFEDGPFAGMSPSQVIETGNKGIAYLNMEMGKYGMGSEEDVLTLEIASVMYNHIHKRFSQMDVEEFAKKLSDGQINSLIAMYGNTFKPENKANFEAFYQKEWPEILQSMNTDKNALIAFLSVLKEY